MNKRIAVGGVIHETNTFVPSLTELAHFTVHEGEAMLRQCQGSPTAIGGSLQGLDQADYQVVPLLYAAAMPSGIVSQHAYETLLNRLRDRLEWALPVDGVLLALHGAMVAESQDDCEGEILESVRARVGPNCPIVSTLDMHGNLTQRMVEATDALVAFNQNPHLDTLERGLEAANILRRMLDEGLRTAKALTRPPLLLNALTTWTERPPLSVVHEHAGEFKKDPHVVNISIMGGFAYADTPFSGASVLVTTDGDRALAQDMARTLAEIAWVNRNAAMHNGIPVDEAVRRALSRRPTSGRSRTSLSGPVVLADVGDNIGGGAPGDGTALLQALLDAGAQDAVVVIADPAAVEQAAHVGVGGMIETDVGGKCDNQHGEPVHFRGVVERLTDGRYVIEGKDHFAQLYGREVDMGPCAVVAAKCRQCDSVRVLLTTRKTPPGNLAQLRSQGLVPEEQKIIVVKSPVAFRGAYQPIAAEIIEVDTPGLCAADLSRFPYRKLRRPIFPLDVYVGGMPEVPVCS